MGDETAARIGAGKRAIIYTRKPQYNERDRTTAEEQLASCRALAAALGYEVGEGATLSDNASNTSLARPGITALIGLVAQGEAAAVILYTLDRLGRPESEGLEALLRELRRRAVPIYIAKTPKGYRYDPATGKLRDDPDEVAAANREEWRPPEFIVIPRETEQDDHLADRLLLRNGVVDRSPGNDGGR